MSNVFDMYKVLQPLHKTLYAMRGDIPSFTNFTTSNLDITIIKHGISIRYKNELTKLFDCMISTNAPVARKVLRPDFVRVEFVQELKISDDNYFLDRWGNSSDTINFLPSDEEYFQKSTLHDIMSYKDIVSLHELVVDLISDLGVQKSIKKSALSHTYHARLILLNSIMDDTFRDLVVQDIMDELMFEVVPEIQQFIESTKKGCI